MLAHTILFDFTIDLKELEDESKSLEVANSIETVLGLYLTNIKLINSISLGNNIIRIYSADLNSLINIKISKNGLITVNIECHEDRKEKQFFTVEKCKSIENDIRERVPNIIRSNHYVPLERGTFCRYYYTSDNRLAEHDVDEIIFEDRSEYQKVQIVHSKSLGNVLVLDDTINMSESNLLYTEMLMARGKENYENKEIVILGGGDGSLIYELLKEKPKNVIMLEIDDLVMKACSTYMSSVCGDVLDKRCGDNYQIIVGDCLNSLNQYIKEGRKFDYIFGDLTDIPIKDDFTKEVWNFIEHLLDLVFKVLKPTGKFMTHVNGTASEDAIKTYESYLEKLVPPVSISKSEAYLRSYLENWTFFQISFA